MKHFNREYFTNEWESKSTRAHRTKKDGIEMWLNKPNVSVVYACLGVCVYLYEFERAWVKRDW